MIDKKKYTEKCLNLVQSDRFNQPDHDSAKTIKGKFKDPYVNSRTTELNKNIVGFTHQGQHLEYFTAQPNDTN